VLPGLEHGSKGLGVAVAGGYFRRGMSTAAQAAVGRMAAALGTSGEVEFPEAARARAAAYVITAAEGCNFASGPVAPACRPFRSRRARPPDRRGNAAGPASVRAQKFRRWYRDQVLRLFESIDAILAPATPFTAPRLGQQTVLLDGAELPLRPNIGIFTQPISFIGLPVVVVPVPLQSLPIGVQIIAPPWREEVVLRIAYSLEKDGVALAPQPPR
jgi:aspartyl-tRNA(Asn)/glutamyl-tRNA(Gln) amidotransferase subunit A